MSVDLCRHLFSLAGPKDATTQYQSSGVSGRTTNATMLLENRQQHAPTMLSCIHTNTLPLDYDILNDMSHLEDFDFTSDFDLFPSTEDTPNLDGGNLYDLPELNSFQNLDDLELNLEMKSPTSSTDTTISTIDHKHRCPHCPASFRRKCDLTRHAHKHTTPFKCPQPNCGATFAENRRCRQHMKVAHGLLNDNDLRKCTLCEYASIRPDAVKRHLRLKHGVH